MNQLENQNKKTVIVLGLARSGTSVVSGIVSILGVEMSGSKTPLPVVPKGSYEDPKFSGLIEKILRKALSWETSVYWEGIELSYSRNKILGQKNNFNEQIKDIILQREQNNTIWGWKYPATHLAIDLFLPYLVNPHFIICFRDPLKIAQSSQEFFTLMKISKKISLFQMLKVINFHNKVILRFLEKHPELPRIFVAFEDVIENPIEETERMADFLGLELTEKKKEKIKEFVIPRERIRKEKIKVHYQNKLKMNLVRKGLATLKKEGLMIFLNKFFRFVRQKFWKKNKQTQRFFLSYHIFRIRHFNSTKIENLINFAFYKLGKIIKPQQIPEEISQLLKVLENRKPKVVLEIGTANGGTLFLFSRILPKDAIIISIDLPEGKFGGGYPKWKIPLYKSFVKGNQKLYLLRKDSHQKETLNEVLKILSGNLLDFLFIDGDHSYEGVKKDFEMYSPLVKKRGIVSFHDVTPGKPKNVGGVPQFWKEVKSKYKHREIVKDWKQGGYGIGVIYK